MPGIHTSHHLPLPADTLAEPVKTLRRPGRISQLFWSVFLVQDYIPLGPAMHLTRNMIIIRHRQELTLINPIRLSDSEEKRLARLGHVTHVLRLGDLPGAAEEYYLKKYQARLWPLPGQLQTNSLKAPFPGGEVYFFRHSNRPEAALLIDEHRLLITNQALQFIDHDSRNNRLADVALWLRGYHPGLNIVRSWLNKTGLKSRSAEADFNDLTHLDFDALIGAHGSFLSTDANLLLCEQLNRLYS